MKKRFYIITTFILAAATLTLSSCLKDPRAQDFSNVGTLVELPLEAYNGLDQLIPEALPIQTTPQTVSLVVNVAAPKALSSNLTVTLAIDQAALDAYNHANGLDTGSNTPYTIPPANAYSIPNLKVTIPAGQHTANLNISVITSNLDPSGAYVIPLTIVDGGGQKISNYKTALLNIQAKNQYDGIYHATGERIHPTLGVLPFDYTVHMATAGPTSVDGPALADLQADLHLTINPDNTVTPTSTYQPLFVPAGETNTYDPATKTFNINVAYNSTAPRIMHIKLVQQ